MNKFYRLVSMLALTGAAFAYTSCTDYSEDIDAINNRIDKLETGRIATVEETIKSLDASLTNAKAAIQALEGRATELEKADIALQGQISANAAQIADAKENIINLQTALAATQKEFGDRISAAVADIAANKVAIGKNADEIAANKAAIQTLNSNLEATKAELAVKVAELNAAIVAGDKALENAMKLADDALELKINGNAEDIAKNAEAIKKNAADIAQNAADIAALTETVEKLDAKVERYNTELITKIEEGDAALANELQELKNAYDAHVEEYKQTVQDLVALQTKVGELQTDLETVKALHGEDIERLEALIAKIEEDYLTKLDAEETYLTIDAYMEWLEGDYQSLLTQFGTVARIAENCQNRLDKILEEPALKEALDDVNTDINALKEGLVEANKAIEAAQADATEALGKIQSLTSALGIYAEAGKLEEDINNLQTQGAGLVEFTEILREAVANNTAAIGENAADIMANADKIAANKGLIEANADKIAANAASILKNADAISTIQTTIAGIQGDIENLQETKLDIAKFGEEFSKELEKALAEDGVITTTIAQAIDKLNAEIQQQITVINNDIDAIKGDIQKIQADILGFKAQVNGMIQSVTFVPEYTDGMASAYWVYVVDANEKEVAISDNVVVKAKFQVHPKELVKKVTESNVTVDVTTLATRAGEGAQNITVAAGTDGLFDLEFELPASYAHKNIAFSVNVNQGEDEAELTDIASCYVQAKNIDINLTDKYVFYNPTTQKVWDNKEYKEDWFDAPALVALYDGYTPYINEGKNDAPVYSTIESVAEKYHLDIEAVTPDYSCTGIVYKDKTGVKFASADEAHLQVNDGAKVSISVKMKAEAQVMKNYVGENVTVASNFKVQNVKVIDFNSKYTVVKHTTTAELKKAANKEVNIPWSHATAVKYSVKNENTGNFTKDGAYTLPIEVGETGIYEFSQHDPEVYQHEMTYNILNIMTQYGEQAVQTVYEGTVNEVVKEGTGKKLENNHMSAEFEPRSGEVANVVLVDVNGYGDNFTGKTYTIETVYEIDDYEDMKIYFQITLGERPTVIKYDVIKGLGYDIKVPITSEDVDIPLNGIAAKSLADTRIADYFTDINAATFAKELATGEHNHSGIEYRFTTPNTDQPLDYPEAYMEPALVDGYIHFEGGQLTNAKYQYKFTDEIDAWYGIKYIYVADQIPFAESKYGLETSNEYVDNGIATIDGKLEIEHPWLQVVHNVLYELKTIDMMKYWNVTTTAALPTSDKLTVKYTVLNNGTSAVHPTFAQSSSTTTATVLNGTDNSGKSVLTMERDTYLLDWRKSNLRSVQVKAELYVGEIYVTESTITLVTDDPITVDPINEIIVQLRPTNETVTVNLWEGVKVNGLLAPEYVDEDGNSLQKNLVVPENPNHFYWALENTHGPIFEHFDVFNAVEVYQIADYGFVNETPKVRIGDDENLVNYDINKYKYDAQAGTLTFYNDNANLKKDVTFTVKFKIGKYYLNNNQSKTCHLSVRFTQPEPTE